MQSSFSSREAVARRPARKGSALLAFLLIGLLPMLAAHLLPSAVLESFEWATYDARMRLRNRLDPRTLSDRVRVVGINDFDVEKLDTDLSSRQAHQELIASLSEWQAACVAFDVFFVGDRDADGPLGFWLSSAAPATILAYNFRRQPLHAGVDGVPPEDIARAFQFVESTEDAGLLRSGVLELDGRLRAGVEELRREDRGEAPASELQARQSKERELAWLRELRERMLRRWFWLTQGTPAEFPHSTGPLEMGDIRTLSPVPMASATALGFANIDKGAEDVVRRMPLVMRYHGRLFPNLTLSTLLAWHGAEFASVVIEWGRELSFTSRRDAGAVVRIPIDRRGFFLVNFREGESYLERNPTLSGVFEGLIPGGMSPPAFFRGSIVLVGEAIAGGLATDVEPIPLQAQFPMVGLHANAIDNVLRGDYVTVPPELWRLATVLFLGLAMAGLFRGFTFSAAARIVSLILAIYLLTAYILFQYGGLVLEMVRPTLGIALSTLGFFAYIVMVKDRDRRVVRDVFLRTVSPRIGEEILRHVDDEALWGARREITVLFIDVRGYTAISEVLGPELMLRLLEEFYDAASEGVFRHDGQVNKFLGDAVLALFGALPEEPPNHAERALRAAAEIQQRMLALNRTESLRARDIELHIGAGINSGEATVGLVGRRGLRFEYTALGDVVNVASRLQASAQEGEIILSEGALERIGDLSGCCRELGLDALQPEHVSLKGKSHPIAVRRLRVAGVAGPFKPLPPGELSS